jgi:arylsulfatase B
VISLDIYATAAELSGAKIPRNKPLDGVNLMPYLTGKNEDSPHVTLFWRSVNKRALRSGDWKVVKNPQRGRGGDWELYNLRADISEQDNLVSQYPEKLQELTRQWEAMNSVMIDPLW